MNELLNELQEIKNLLKFQNKEGLKMEEAMEYSGIGRNNLTKLCIAGIIQHKKIGVKKDKYIISKTSLNNYLNSFEDEENSGAKIVNLSRR